MTEEREVNPLRALMVENIINQNSDVPITVGSLAPLLPDNFDLGEDDLELYRERHPHEAEPTPAQREAADMVQGILSGDAPIVFEGESEQTPEAVGEAEAKAKAKAFNGHRERQRQPIKAPEADSLAPAPATPEQIEAATLRRNKAEQTLANARVAVMVAQNAERGARAKLAEAVTTFQKGFPKVTHEQLMRDVIASEQQRKAAGHPLRPQGQPGKSVVDRVAFYGRGGNPARGDYRRGAFAASAKGAPNYDPRRGAVAAKVPSER
jgi:hypothetical protein